MKQKELVVRCVFPKEGPEPVKLLEDGFSLWLRRILAEEKENGVSWLR